MSDHIFITVFGLAIFFVTLLGSNGLWNIWSTLLTIVIFIMSLYVAATKRPSAALMSVTTILIICIFAQWGIAQFISQRGLGLYLLGETRIDQRGAGIAKYLMYGEKVIRSYGPYNHPNIFSGVLIFGITLLTTWFLNSKDRNTRVFCIITLFVMVSGVVMTFSRSSFIAILLLAIIAFLKHRSIHYWRYLIPIILLILVFYPHLMARFTDPEDRSVEERISAGILAQQIIRERSIWRGVGWQYMAAVEALLNKKRLAYERWQIDFVHSVPLLLAATAGLAPAIILMAVITLVLVYYYKQNIILVLPIIPLLLFDHYLLTHSEAAGLALASLVLMPRAIN